MKDGTSMTRMVTPTRLARLDEWSRRKPVVALMGEFSAGKSTLTNLLMAENILPMQVTATRLPPVWLRYGTGAPYRVDRRGRRHPVDWQDIASIPLHDTRFVRLYCEAEILKHCDLIDMPGISDPSVPAKLWTGSVGYANAVMWCTHAGQAWRESERGAWTSLPERLRETSILLVTRKDKLKSAEDARRIDRRLAREAGDLFNARIFVSLTAALAASEAGDTAGWEASGAREFLERLETILEAITMRRRAMFARYESVAVASHADDAPIGDETGDAGTTVAPAIDDGRYFVLRNAVVPEVAPSAMADDTADAGKDIAGPPLAAAMNVMAAMARPAQDRADPAMAATRPEAVEAQVVAEADPAPVNEAEAAGEEVVSPGGDIETARLALPETEGTPEEPAPAAPAAPAAPEADGAKAAMIRDLWAVIDRHYPVAKTLTLAELVEGLLICAGGDDARRDAAGFLASLRGDPDGTGR